MKLVEECAGVGELISESQVFRRVRYHISRFQGMAHSGMPIPGLHRLEGSIELHAIPHAASLVGSSLTLRLDDGRTLAITLTGEDGRVLAEGHGPRHGCSCC
ncbi:MAG TPA: hypothetical protein VJA26_02045 [Gammaproteobacteria bacterium]|nr:hypothetical protein [Gammaproteobacteria bacterium]